MRTFINSAAGLLGLLLTAGFALAQEKAQPLKIVLGVEEPRDYPLGPIGGQFRVTDGATYARVVSVDAGGPGATAGLRPGDCITGAFGKTFPPTSYNARGEKIGFHYGVTQELGMAIDRAEAGSGSLPLQVLRPGEGSVSLTVQLPRTVDGRNPLYLLTSAKYAASYEKAVAYLHTAALGMTGGYHLGWTGLALLGHPDWNQTTGDRPYRLSINKLRDAAMAVINGSSLIAVEGERYDGNAWTNPNAYGINTPGGTSSLDSQKQSVISNWELGQYAQFLAEYLARTYVTDDATTRANVVAALQRAMVQSANTIQWWKQPSGQEGYTIVGISGHGGVWGDYNGSGINATGTHTFVGLSFGRRAGQIAGNAINMNARPRDGHYFGYSDAEFDALRNATGSNPLNTYQGTRFKIVEPEKVFTNDLNDTSTFPSGGGAARKIYTSQAVSLGEHFDPSINEKFLMQWSWLSIGASGGSPEPDELHTGYIAYGASYDEDVGKTGASITGMELYKLAGGTLRADEQTRLDYMKNYVSRQTMRQQDAHAYNLGAQSQWAFSLPFMNDRQLQYALETWSFYYTLSRTFNDGFAFVRARTVNNNYLDDNISAAINLALPRAIARGAYTIVPGFNRNRVVPRFDNPDLRWPTHVARYLESSSRTVAMPITVYDGSGNVLNASDYTVTWSKVSGLGNVTFAGDGMSFSSDGVYRVKATIVRNGYTLEEPVDVVVRTLPPPAGYAGGAANFQIYKNIAGATVDKLIQSPKFPEFPDSSSLVTQTTARTGGFSSGSRLSGLIIAPTAGTYRFYISSSEGSQLKLNLSSQVPAEGTVVARVDGSVSEKVYTAQASQQSVAFSLAEGQIIAFEALQKWGGWDGGWGDHLSVAWSVNGGPIEIIPGAHLAYPDNAATPSMKILTQPVSVQGTTGGTVTLTFTTEGPSPAMYQWRRNGAQVGTVSTSPNLTLANLSAGMEGTYDCTYTTPYGTLTTETVRVTVTDAGTIGTGGLWREVYTGISGKAVADLTSNAKYPYQSDTSGVIGTAMAPSGYGDNYGQRITGWVTPPSDGKYRFFVASDDDSEVWLSTDSSTANAVKILSFTGWAGDRSWSTNATSAYIPLVAGQKYYIQILHKEGSGGDNLAVTWQKEGGALPTTGSGELPSSALSYRKGGIYPDTILNNVAPVFLRTSFTAPQAYAAQAYTGFTLAGLAYDPNSTDFAGLTFSKVSGPSWLAVSSTGAFSGTPAASDVSTNTFTVRVSDAAGLSSTATVSVVVRGQNVAPSFATSTITTANAFAWVPYSGQTLAGKVSDANSWASLTFSKISGPAWLTVAADGSLGGAPVFSDCGTNTFTVRAVDEGGLSVDATLSIDVRPVSFRLGVNGAYFSGTRLTGFTKGQTINLTGEVTKGFEVISKVEFYVDNVLLATDTTFPYSATYTDAQPGNHTLRAVITTSAGNSYVQNETADIFVDYPPQVVSPVFATGSFYPAGTVLGSATVSSVAPGRTLNANSWTLVSGNQAGAFSFDQTGKLTLLNPSALTKTGVVQLRVSVADDQGLLGYGAITIICNPPSTTGVKDQRWTSRTTYENNTWSDLTTLTYTGVIPSFTSQVEYNEESQRLTGLLQPPVSGNYRFWVASDDASRLYLSTDENPANKVLVARVDTYTSFQAWNSGIQESADIYLEAGKVYYMEVQHFANGGNDHASVAWLVPGSATKVAVPSTAIFPAYPLTVPGWVGLSPITGSPLAGVPLMIAPSVLSGTSTVASVEFYAGANKIGTSTAAPFAFSWPTPITGTHTLTAKALAAGGAVVATSNAITVTIGVNNDPLADSDADGFLNGLETMLGSDPQSANSTPPSYYAGLRSWWQFDDTSGTNLVDSTGRNVFGTMVDTPVRIVGLTGGALSFDGVNDGVLVGSKGALDGAADFTLSAWVKTTSTSDGTIIAQRGPSWDNVFLVRAQGDGRVRFEIYGGGSQFNIYTTAKVNDGQWHQVIVQREGAAGRIYIDGALAGSATGTIRSLSATQSLAIGYDALDGVFFKGAIDDVRVYTRALNASDVTALYQEPFITPRAPVFLQNPIARGAYATKPILGSLVSFGFDINIGLGGDEVTYSKVSGPAWLAVAVNGDLSGTPASTGTNSFVVRITDKAGHSADATLNVTVTAPPYWSSLSNGNWSDTTRWSGGVVASGAGELADFSAIDLTAATTVNLDGARTIGSLVFGDTTPSHDWTLSTSNSSQLTLSNSNITPSVTVNSRTATISTVLVGTQGLTKEGAGTLVLSGNNTYTGNTVVNAGTLVVNQNLSGFNSSAFHGEIIVNPGATIQFDNSPQGWGGGLTAIKVNGGSVTGSNGLGAFGVVYTLTGGTIVNAGKIDLGRYNAIDGAINSLASSTTSVVSNGIQLRVDSGQTGYVFNTAAGTTPSGVDLQLSGAIWDVNGTANVTKAGEGTLALNGASTYKGTTSVSAGTLLVNGSLPSTTATTVAAGATLGGTGTLNGSATINGTLAPGWQNTGMLSVKGTLTLAGTSVLRFNISKSGTTLSVPKLSTPAAFAAGGTLTVTASGDALVSGDTLTLFDVSPTGTFATVNLPALPSHLAWQTSNNYRTVTIATIGTPKTVPTITWNPPATVTYGAAVGATALSASANVPGSFSYTPAAGTVLGAGSRTLTATFTPNDTTTYETVTRTVTLTVNKAVLTATAENKSKVQGAANPALTITYSGFVPGESVSAITPPTIATTATTSSPSGTYPITLSGGSAANYTLTLSNGTLTVSAGAATPTITWAPPAAITYGTALSSAQLNATASVPGTFSYSPAAGAVLGSGALTLTVAFTPEDTAAYSTATKTVTLTVNKAPLLAKADDQLMSLGGSLPALTISYSGFVNGETKAVITEPAATTTATSASAAGTYAITLSGGAAANYALTLQNGTLTVGAGRIIYISPTGVDNASSGLSATAPWKTLAYAGSRLLPGDTVYLMDGVHTNTSYSPTARNIWNAEKTAVLALVNGTAEAPITIRPMPGASPILRGDGDFILQLRKCSYIRVTGLVIEGEVERIPLSEARQYQFAYRVGTGTTVNYRLPAGTNTDASGLPDISSQKIVRPSAYNTIGLLVQDGVNITIENCEIRYCPGTGLRVDGGDYIQIRGNAIHNNSRRGASGNHGLVISSLASADTNNGEKVVIEANRVFDNYNEVFSWSELKTFVTAKIDEGKGLSLQKITSGTGGWNNGRVVIRNNVTHGNGFSGVHLNQCERVDMFNNLSYENNRSYDGTGAGNTGVSVSEGKDVRVYNNVSVSVGKGFAFSVDAASSNFVFGSNLAVGAVDPLVTAGGATVVSADNLFVNASAGDFRPRAGSPSIGAALASVAPARDFSGATRDANPDAGPYEYNATVSGAVNPVISLATPAPITYGTALSASLLNATADVPGTFSYSPVLGTVLPAGTQTVTLIFTPTNTAMYAVATRTVTVTVNKASLTASADNKAKVQGATNPALTITYTGFVNNETVAAISAPAISTTAVTTSVAGTYAITLSGGSASNYTLSLVNGTLSVTDKPLPVITWATPTAITYGTPLSATQLNATANVAGTFSYSPAASTVLAAGAQTLAATFTPADTTAYSSTTQSVTLTINKAALTATAENKSKVQGVANPALTIAYSGFVNGDTASLITPPSIATTATTASAPGMYAITLSGGSASNYTLTRVDGILTVVSKTVPTVSWATPAAITYGTALSTTQLNATANVPGVFNYSVAVGEVLGAGDRSITVDFTPNDTVNYATASRTVTLTVNKAPLTATADNKSMSLGGAVPALTISYSGFLNGESVAAISPPTAALANTALSTTGSYDINLTGGSAANYQLTLVKGTLSVLDKQVPVITWPAPGSIVYGTPLSAAQLNATTGIPGTFTYTPAAGVVLAAGSPTLSVTFTPQDTATYASATYSLALSVNKAVLTATAENKSKVQGAANPTLTIAYSGFVNGDTASSITPPGITTDATTSSAPGMYAITLSGGSASNYTLTRANGVLTVVTKTLPVISWPTPAAITYGTALGSAQLSATANVEGSFAYSPAAGTMFLSGSQTLSVTFTPNDTVNYSPASQTVNLLVNKAPLVVLAEDKSKYQGADNPPLTIRYSGFVNGESASTVVAPTPATSATKASPAGSYDITLSGGSAANYALTLVPGILRVAAGQPPVIMSHPMSTSVTAPGATVSFSVGATGEPAPTYQWYRNGESIEGKTQAFLTLVNAQAESTGWYWVVVSNSAGSVTSRAAVFEIRQAGNTATHAVVGNGFVPGQPVTVVNNLTYTGTASAVTWRVLLPAGWKFASTDATNATKKPTADQADLLEWEWSNPPAGSVAFRYTVTPLSGSFESLQIVGLAGVVSGSSLQFMVQPDPLEVGKISKHSADSNQDGRISLIELTRVIELYNFRSGTTRTGQYKPQAGTEDGFAPGP